MSNHRAIAAVTAVLAELLGDAIKDVVASAHVHTMRPGKAVAANAAGVNVYLYRATPNPGLRNIAEPSRASDGRLQRRPVAAWDLHYLLTCIGEEEHHDPEVLLGAVLTGLAAQSTLPRPLIALVDAALAADNTRKHAAGSGLGEQVDLVRLTPVELSLESMAQLWSSLTTETYALSLAVQVGAVLMSPELTTTVALPVGGRPALSVAGLRLPTLTAVLDAEGPGAPILMRSTLVIEGERLRSAHALLRLGALEIPLSAAELGERRIELPLSPDDGGGPTPRALAPGALAVQLCHLVDTSAAGDGSALRPGAASNVMSCVLRPALTGAPSVTSVDVGGVSHPAIEVPISPTPAPRWDYALLLNEYGVGAPRSLMLARWIIDDGGAEPRLLFLSDDVPAGEWLLRVQVNGADSPLLRSGGIYSEPRVTVPP